MQSPVLICTTSPGTNSLASIVDQTPSLRHLLSIACRFLRASSALSALLSYHTATVPLIIRISRITNGSIKAVMPSSPSPVSAIKNETVAAPRRI